MKSIVHSLVFAIMMVSILWGDVKSIEGQIDFDLDSNHVFEMKLNATGLGIGIAPSANLHVQGNAIITQKMFVGSSSGSANLNVDGTVGYGFETLTSDANLDISSLYLADTSSGNLIATLPYAGNAIGRMITVKKISNQNRLEIYASSENMIDGSYKSLSFSQDFPSIELVSDGSKWYITKMTSSANLDWTPEEIDTEGWFDSSDTSTIVYSGDNISQWSDKSGKNRHATQVTTDYQPVYGNKSIDFNGGQFFRIPGNLVTFGDAGIFVVAEDSASGYIIGSTGGDASAKSRCYLKTDRAFYGRNDGGQQDYAFLTDNTIKTLRVSVNSDNPSPLDIFGYTNGAQTGTESQYAFTGLTNPEQMYFGCRSNSANEASPNYQGFITGKIYEVVFTAAPDTSTREKIEGYLAWKWGLQDSLDAGHTYKNSPPLR